MPLSTGNLSIPCAVEGTARMADISGLLIMPLYDEGYLITMKFIQAVVEWYSLPIITSMRNCLMGQIFSPVKPVSDVVAGIS